jgi:CRISPR-associated protein Cas2
MIIVSYDIKNDKLRTRFAKMLTRHGAIRLQYSVYEVNHTRRIIDNIKLQIEEEYGQLFTPDDSVVVFEVSNTNVMKFGNAIHRDKEIVYL